MDNQSKAEAIRLMKMSEGWNLIESYIVTRKIYHRDQLMTVNNMENIIKHRASIKALDGLMVYTNNVDQEDDVVEGD